MAAESLPSEPPNRNASAEEQLAWVTAVCQRDFDPIISVQRYGYQADSHLVIKTKNDKWIATRQRDLCTANGLRHALLCLDSNVIPAYNAISMAKITAALLLAADTSARRDELDALVDDVVQFLEHALERPVLHGSSRDSYRLVCDLVRLNQRSYGLWKPATLAVVDGDRLWVPRGALLSDLRSRTGRVSPSEIRAALEELSWIYLDLSRRPPHGIGQRITGRLWSVGLSWPPMPQLASLVASATRLGQKNTEC